jgi:hypothetical protein
MLWRHHLKSIFHSCDWLVNAHDCIIQAIIQIEYWYNLCIFVGCDWIDSEHRCPRPNSMNNHAYSVSWISYTPHPPQLKYLWTPQYDFAHCHYHYHHYCHTLTIFLKLSGFHTMGGGDRGIYPQHEFDMRGYPPHQLSFLEICFLVLKI